MLVEATPSFGPPMSLASVRLRSSSGSPAVKLDQVEGTHHAAWSWRQDRIRSNREPAFEGLLAARSYAAPLRVAICATRYQRVLAPVFCKMLCTCCLTVPTLNPNRRAMALFDMPSATQTRTSLSRWVSRSQCWPNATLFELVIRGSPWTRSPHPQG